jgi:NAD(P)-dependent dehydrogenase (short-subunit alcohol dehydrogenase family)
MEERPFTGQVALVTGASKGIGRAVAVRLAGRGAAVWLVGRDEADLQRAGEEVRAAGGEAFLAAGDVTDESSMDLLPRRLLRESGQLDLLVHSAGVFRRGGVEDLPVAELDEQYRINLRAPFQLTQKLLPMLTKTKGQVVFVNSTAGLAAGPLWGAYCATKAAMKMLADSLRAEVNDRGIRVLSVYPGRTATPMQKAIHLTEGKPYRPDRLLQPEDVARAVLDALALPRTAELTDLTIRPMRKA